MHLVVAQEHWLYVSAPGMVVVAVRRTTRVYVSGNLSTMNPKGQHPMGLALRHVDDTKQAAWPGSTYWVPNSLVSQFEL